MTAEPTVSRVMFANARDGWAFGPRLSETVDGGRRWTYEDEGGSVAAMATLDGWAYGAVRVCRPVRTDRTCQIHLERVRMATTAWHPLAADAPPAGTSAERVASPPSSLWMWTGCTRLTPPGNPTPATALVGTVDGGRTWEKLMPPCRVLPSTIYPIGAVAAGLLAASDRATLAAVCGGGSGGAGETSKGVSGSADGGRTWWLVLKAICRGRIGSRSLLVGGDILDLTATRRALWLGSAQVCSWSATTAVGGGHPSPSQARRSATGSSPRHSPIGHTDG